METIWAQIIGGLFGLVITGLQVVIVMFQKANSKKLDEVCHRVFHHSHDEHGNVVITG